VAATPAAPIWKPRLRRSEAAADHFHPALAVLDQAFLERLARRIARTGDAGVARIGEVFLHHIPRQLVGELERLDQSLFFQIGKRALLARRHCPGELIKRLGVIGKALLSADDEFTHVLLTLFVLCRTLSILLASLISETTQ
jgi:hypothetical protein